MGSCLHAQQRTAGQTRAATVATAIPAAKTLTGDIDDEYSRQEAPSGGTTGGSTVTTEGRAPLPDSRVSLYIREKSHKVRMGLSFLAGGFAEWAPRPTFCLRFRVFDWLCGIAHGCRSIRTRLPE